MSLFNQYDDFFKKSLEEIYNKSYQELKLIKKNIIIEKIKFLKQICIDQKLNYDEIKLTYFSSNILLKFDDEQIINKNNDEPDKEIILNQIMHDGNEYFYDETNNKLYNLKNKHVGMYNDDKIIFF